MRRASQNQKNVFTILIKQKTVLKFQFKSCPTDLILFNKQRYVNEKKNFQCKAKQYRLEKSDCSKDQNRVKGP